MESTTTGGGAGIGPSEYADRRRRVLDALGGGALLLASGSESADPRARFRPASDFYYLTGFREPDAVLVLRDGDRGAASTLFVRPRDATRETWDGTRAGPEGARAGVGVDAAWPIAQLEKRLPALLDGATRVVFEPWSSARLDRAVRSALASLRAGERAGRRAPDVLVHPRTVVHPLRVVKSAAEIALMERAAEISAQGHLAAMARCAPGAREAQLQAALEACFLDNGALGPAYATIVGAGANACTLHYTENSGTIREGDLLLVDAGAEVEAYAADITRTYPAAGVPRGRVRALYDVVLEAEECAIDAARPGRRLVDVHDAAVGRLARGLVELGLAEGPPERVIEQGAYRQWFMHRTSHWLGLDVHDAGPYVTGGESIVLEPGMVLTVEPGLYVRPDDDAAPEELRGRGVRIEDDVVVTQDAPRVLTRGVPVDPVAIAEILGSDAREGGP